MDLAPRHAEPSAENIPPAPNPLAGALTVLVSVPDSIEIRMVDASVLSDYEIWFCISSVLSSAVVSFFIGYLQALETKAANANQLLWTDVVFLLLFIISALVTWFKRRTLHKLERCIKLRATSEVLGQSDSNG